MEDDTPQIPAEETQTDGEHFDVEAVEDAQEEPDMTENDDIDLTGEKSRYPHEELDSDEDGEVLEEATTQGD